MNDTCRIPVKATYVIDRQTGEITRTAATWADIPADVIAKFLLERCGHDAIFGGGDND